MLPIVITRWSRILKVFLGVEEFGHGSFHLTFAVVAKTHATFRSDLSKCCHNLVFVEIYWLLLRFETVLLLKNELAVIDDMKVLIFVIHLSVYNMTVIYLLNLEEG